MRPYEQFSIGEFSVMAFDANHDVPCYSFLIYHEEMGKLLFVTDSNGVNGEFGRLDHIMIECNYSDDLLEQAIAEGRTKWFVARRTRDTHFGLDGVNGFLSHHQYIDVVREVILLHLSHENSDADKFQQSVAEHCPCPVYVATDGLELNLE